MLGHHSTSDTVSKAIPKWPVVGLRCYVVPFEVTSHSHRMRDLASSSTVQNMLRMQVSETAMFGRLYSCSTNLYLRHIILPGSAVHAVPIYHSIIMWYGNSLFNYNPQSVTMIIHVHCGHLQGGCAHVRVWIMQQISYCLSYSHATHRLLAR